MTALNWILTEDVALVMSDTLVVEIDVNEPMYFSQKVMPIVHAGTLIAGTGSIELLSHVLVSISSRSICRDASDINRALPSLLRDTFAAIGIELKSTIYTFGWNEDGGVMEGHAFRSTNKFVAERIEFGLGIKPQMELNIEHLEIEPYEKFFVELSKLQKTHMETKENGAVKIGGELILYQMDKYEIVMKKIHRFEDYSQMLNFAIYHHK